MNILEHTYRIEYSKEDVYDIFQDIGRWSAWTPHIKKVLRLNSKGVCQTLLISLTLGGREESLKFFRILKPGEWIEMELLSTSELLRSYKGQWFFEGEGNSCLVRVKHVVELGSTMVTSTKEVPIDYQKEERIINRSFEKMNRSLIREILANLQGRKEAVLL